MNILVTGGAGFIGSNFVRYWHEQHPDDSVVALDALTYAGVRENVEGIPGVTFVQADIGDTPTIESILREHSVDVIVNFAAESVFFILMILALFDVVAGFTITIKTARRDLALGQPSGGP